MQCRPACRDHPTNAAAVLEQRARARASAAGAEHLGAATRRASQLRLGHAQLRPLVPPAVRRLRADRPLECVKRCECAHLVKVRVRVGPLDRVKGCELLNARTQLRQVECRGRVGMRRRSSTSAVARARIVQVDVTAADAARSIPRICDIISATISAGTISAKSRAPKPHDAASSWLLDTFRLESRVVGGAAIPSIAGSIILNGVFRSLRMIVRDGNFGPRFDLACIVLYTDSNRQNFEHNCDDECCNARARPRSKRT